nr:hypothetical protein [Methyloceanibacter marginalis]
MADGEAGTNTRSEAGVSYTAAGLAISRTASSGATRASSISGLWAWLR